MTLVREVRRLEDPLLKKMKMCNDHETLLFFLEFLPWDISFDLLDKAID